VTSESHREPVEGDCPVNEVHVQADQLRDFAAALLTAAGATEEDARITAEVLVASDLRGHESHGVARLLPYYVYPLQQGLINRRPCTTVRRETAATLVIDADNGLGHPVTKRTMDQCIAKARVSGICVGVIKHSNHFGIAGYYAMQALEHDMIGYCSTDSGPLAVPTGGTVGILGSNPIAFAAPARRKRPFVLDMATSVVPVGKVEVKARRGAPLPLGWAVDADGQPESDAGAVLERLSARHPGGLMPLGGLEAGHKGYGLSALVDILCSVLAGARYGLSDPRGRDPGTPPDVNHIVAALDIAAFGSVEDFKDDMDTYLESLHRVPPAPGVDRVRVAGEPEWEALDQRRTHGVPLLPRVAEALRAAGSAMGVTAPF
jgi:L-2-hydroxycarboxylate dehydrogenase (NAD+)